MWALNWSASFNKSRLGYPSEVVRIKAGVKSVSVGIAAARGSTMLVEPTELVPVDVDRARGFCTGSYG